LLLTDKDDVIMKIEMDDSNFLCLFPSYVCFAVKYDY